MSEYRADYGSFLPSVPKLAERVVDAFGDNPFVEGDRMHPRLRGGLGPLTDALEVEINAFIKICMNFSNKKSKGRPTLADTAPLRFAATSTQSSVDTSYILATFHRDSTMSAINLEPPPDFGGPAFERNFDRHLFHFCERPIVE